MKNKNDNKNSRCVLYRSKFPRSNKVMANLKLENKLVLETRTNVSYLYQYFEVKNMFQVCIKQVLCKIITLNVAYQIGHDLCNIIGY